MTVNKPETDAVEETLKPRETASSVIQRLRRLTPPSQIAQRVLDQECVRIELERLLARLLASETQQQQLAQRIHALIEQWRATATQTDTFHATMGTGWHVCADELAAIASPLPSPPKDI